MAKTAQERMYEQIAAEMQATLDTARAWSDLPQGSVNRDGRKPRRGRPRSGCRAYRRSKTK